MLRENIMLFFLLTLCLLFNVQGELVSQEVLGLNNSDKNVDNDVLRRLVIHLTLNLEEMNLKLKKMEEQHEELRKIVENNTSPTSSRGRPTSNSGSHFINNLYQQENIATSTEMPVVPTSNVSTMENMLKLFVRRTCEDWLNSGFTTSGTYTIDPDGQGIGEPPFSVYCDMLTGFTFLRHNMDVGQHSATPCKGPGCYRVKLSYSTSETQMRALIQSSQTCQQLVSVDCFESPFETEDLKLSWWIGLDGEQHYDWVGKMFPKHTCACGLAQSCVNPMKPCNCDASLSNVWVTDSGYVSNISALPIQELAFGSADTPLQVRFRVGPLRCHGSRNLSYPTSCLDLFLHGGRRSGWYVIGEPRALRITFCDMESLHDTQTVSSSTLSEDTEGVKPIDVDLGDLVLQNLQSKGFVIVKAEQFSKIEDKLELMNNEIMHCMNETQNQDNNINSNIELLKSNITNLREVAAANKTIVIFHAVKSSGTLAAANVMKYDLVTINVGDGYSAETGKFTAPVSGFYYIAAYNYKHTDNQSYFSIRRNEANIAFARNIESSHDYNTMGTAVIVHLKVGDVVDVYLRSGNIRGDSERGTSFMGYLLNEAQHS